MWADAFAIFAINTAGVELSNWNMSILINETLVAAQPAGFLSQSGTHWWTGSPNGYYMDDQEIYAMTTDVGSVLSSYR